MKQKKMAVAVLAAAMFGTFAVQTAGIVGTEAFAEGELQPGDAFVDGDLSYRVLENGTLRVFGPKGNEALEKVIIPAEVKGRQVTDVSIYGYDNLISVTIPSSVTTISSPFDRCPSLTEIKVDLENTAYSSEYGVLLSKDKTALIKYPEGKTDKSYTIPVSVTEIGYRSFHNCQNLTSVTITEGITEIGEGAFDYCQSLTSITIPDSVTTIGDHAFSDCKSLTSIIIPDSVTEVGEHAFQDCTSLASVTLSNNITKISDQVFDNCDSLTSITIPNGVTEIEFYAFYGCNNLTSVTIPNSVTTIGTGAFLECTSLTSITIPDSVTTIGDTAFFATSLTSVTIPASVSYMDKAFGGCASLAEINIDPSNSSYISEDNVVFNKDKTKLVIYPAGKTDKSYIIPGGVMEIENTAFSGRYSNLTSVIIPDSVVKIGHFTFCDEGPSGFIIPFKDFYFGGTEEDWNKLVAMDVINYSTVKLHYNCIPVSFTDSITKINATGIVTKGTTFSVTPIEEQTNETQVAYDISFVGADGKKILPESDVTVKIPVPETFKDKTFYVYHVVDGKKVSVNFTVEDDMIIFEADHFSTFIISEKTLNSTKPVNTPKAPTTASDKSSDDPAPDNAPHRHNSSNRPDFACSRRGDRVPQKKNVDFRYFFAPRSPGREFLQKKK